MRTRAENVSGPVTFLHGSAHIAAMTTSASHTDPAVKTSRKIAVTTNTEASSSPFALTSVVAGLALSAAVFAWAGGPEGTHVDPVVSSVAAAVLLLAGLALNAGRNIGRIRRGFVTTLFAAAAYGAAKAVFAWPHGLEGAYLRPIPTTVVALVLAAAALTAGTDIRRRTAPKRS